eukprot:scaffold255384_cov79-Cyclotella_meneghiniana.AAC.1
MFSAASRCWLRVGRCRLIVGGSGLSSTHHHSRMISDVMGWQQLQTKNIPLFFGHQLHMQRWQSSTSHRSNHKETVRISFNDCRNVGDVLKLVMKHNIDKLPPSTTAATWNSISRLIFKDQRFHHKRLELEQQIRTLLQHTTDSLSRCRQKELAIITLSIAKIVRSIREAHERGRVNFYHQAFGKVLQESSANPNQGMSHALAKATDANLPRFDARQLSNTAYAYALLGYDPKIDGKSLLGGIAKKSIDCIHQFNEQDLAIMIWSYAKLKVDNPRLFQSVGDAVASKRDLIEFAPQNLANIVWAYAANSILHPNLFLKIGDAVASKHDLSAFKPQDFANIVWAYATTNVQHAGLFQNVGDSIAAMDDLRSFKPQDFANIVWAYATNKTKYHGLFQTVGDSIVAMDDLRSFKPQDFANIVWAYATNNLQHLNLFRKVGDTIASSDGSKVFTTQALANIVWAYAKLDVKHPSLFKKIGKSIGALDDLSSFNSQELANIAWSFSVADIDVPIAFNDVFLRALVVKQNEFNVKGLRQLYKWHVWQIEKSNTGLPESIRERCEQARR